MIESVPPAVADEVATMGFRADGGGWRIGWHSTETPLDLVAAGREIASLQEEIGRLRGGLRRLKDATYGLIFSDPNASKGAALENKLSGALRMAERLLEPKP